MTGVQTCALPISIGLIRVVCTGLSLLPSCRTPPGQQDRDRGGLPSCPGAETFPRGESWGGEAAQDLWMKRDRERKREAEKGDDEQKDNERERERE